ncbi:hypothetical protein M4951_14175 [Blastopirellula sp. J2-11]|uniref:hypothetical protein n=1 Tax=Blastopirellula sp. J2-11 TaxID=2943192 RepID=UPI0021C93CD8|nr:hypothetical protein [Blastopirellula sp. J2-11]UUO04537.1 hypothetical protein M4951_14175 [Blastopirellula sp. J2-11]
MTNLSLLMALVTALGAFATGCSSGQGDLRLVPVTGNVTYQGEPIRDGVIRLIPSSGTTTPVRTRKIREGAYQFTDRFAVAAGSYRVEIIAYRPREGAPSAEVDPIAAEAAREQFLPKQFNVDSQIDPLVVATGSDEITKNFDL